MKSSLLLLIVCTVVFNVNVCQVSIFYCNNTYYLCKITLKYSSQANHSNNWAVLVDTSRFWFNYRHVANVLSIYRSVKRLGIPDRYEMC